MTEVLLLILAVLLALACGAFVAAEFSLTTVERGELEAAAERGDRGAPGALAAVRNLTFQLSGAQLGITVTNLVIGMLSEPSIARLLSGPLGALGLSSGVTSTVALVLGTTLSTMFLMVVGELVPKNWAISAPLEVATRVAGPMRLFSRVFHPFIKHLNGTANRVVRRFGMEPSHELDSARGPQELAALARHSAKEGALEAGTAELFVRTLSLAELTAGHIMTPRVRVVALEAEASCADVVAASRRSGLSRFPVHRDGLDTVLGIVHLKDVLRIPAAELERTGVAPLLREPLLVPGSLPVDRLLDRLTAGRTMAVVVDEYGGTAGVATLEDIVEEVVGDVRDEHDPRAFPELSAEGAAPEGRERWSAEGSVRTDRLAAIGLRPPQGPYETLAGLLATELGRIPAPGDRAEVAGWELRVTRASGRRAERVALLGPAPDGAGGRHGSGAGARVPVAAYGREERR